MASDIDRVVAALERVAESVVKQITLDATANLIETTPVDTGFAKASWVPSIGSPFKGVSGGSGRDKKTGRFTSGSGDVGRAQAAQQGAITAIIGYKLAQGRVYISNNVRYIQKLNAGSSKQAPAGFVQAAIAKAVRGVAT